jgi:HrpA-like RNA helicase
MFSAELARYYTDNNNNIKEIEAQLYPVETRFNRKRVQVMDKEDNNPAMQTSILA